LSVPACPTRWIYVDWFDFSRRTWAVRAFFQHLISVTADTTIAPAKSYVRELLWRAVSIPGAPDLSQNSASAGGTTLSSNSQFATDLAALGSALTSGNLSSAQSAFATVLGDLKNSASPAQTNEATAASQTVELVNELLSTVNSSSGNGTSSTSSDPTTSILDSFYGSKSGLNVLA
jgi:hypothetical protein